MAVGGDGYLSTWDIRKPNVAAMSDQMEDELLSVALVKNGKKAVVGTQDGVLTLWSWGDWGDYNDRIMGHPNSIDAICKLDEDTICTGSSDGIIRYVVCRQTPLARYTHVILIPQSGVYFAQPIPWCFGRSW